MDTMNTDVLDKGINHVLGRTKQKVQDSIRLFQIACCLKLKNGLFQEYFWTVVECQ